MKTGRRGEACITFRGRGRDSNTNHRGNYKNRTHVLVEGDITLGQFEDADGKKIPIVHIVER